MPTPSNSSDSSVKSNSKRLIGKTLHFVWDPMKRRRRCGWYAGRVVTVEVVKRVTKRTAHLKVGDLRSITVALSNPETMKYDGQRVKLHPQEWQKQSCGIVFRKEWRTPEELMQ